jgi:ADP-heptose:LPS heptosyltransferase/glycosyltransferase involved in cell wall biosynthesis
MNKIRTLLKAPILTNSGYGVHSRIIFRSLINDPLFDVYVDSLKWGNCSFITEESPEKEAIKDCMGKRFIAEQQGQNQYDLFIHVTIPNEWEKLGKINIGVTAGIETDKCSHVWIQKCNEMDLVIVPSEHSKRVFETTVVDWQNQQTGEKGVLKCMIPVVVCHEGVDVSIFRKLDKLYDNSIAKMEFAPGFNFLHVGQWGKGSYGEDRKNIANLVKYFIETFFGQQDVGLILKINMSRNNMADLNAVQTRLGEIKTNYPKDMVPPIYLLHGTLTNEEMANLYNHPQIKAFVSLTHGEGFGLPLAEAAACDLPVIATNWSGQLDFLRKDLFSAVNYELNPIPDVAVWDPVLIKGSKWASVKEEDAKHRLKKITQAYSKPKEWAKELGQIVRDDFCLEVVCSQFSDLIKQYLMMSQQEKPVMDPVEILKASVDTPANYNVLYTMPMSNGDVFISTAVIDGLMKDVPEDAKVYFATQPKYFPILKGNPHIHKCIPWQNFMMNIDVTETIFDLVLTPNIPTQYTFSNWVRRGQGRLLAEEFANHCQTQLGDYFIETAQLPDITLPERYITFHPGSGVGQWEARRYEDWQEVLYNLKKKYSDLQIVQVGGEDEPLSAQTDVDLRGKTDVHQLAGVIKGSSMHLSIDTFTMHMAGAFEVPLVAIFGCSHAKSTGPWVKNKETARYILLESERHTCKCQKACYKNKPIAGNGYGPINEIDPRQIFDSCVNLLG